MEYQIKTFTYICDSYSSTFSGVYYYKSMGVDLLSENIRIYCVSHHNINSVSWVSWVCDQIQLKQQLFISWFCNCQLFCWLLNIYNSGVHMFTEESCLADGLGEEACEALKNVPRETPEDENKYTSLYSTDVSLCCLFNQVI